MRQIKQFYDESDETINNWLAENKNLEIIDIKLSTVEIMQDWHTEIMVIYEDKYDFSRTY